MTSPLYIAQQIFSAYTASTNGLSESCINGTASNTTQIQQSSAPAFPTDVSSLFSFFLSFSALREWLKLLVLGSVLESLRRLAFYLYYRIYSSFFITARFEDGDTSYCASLYSFEHIVPFLILSTDWMMVWLSKRPEWSEY